MTEFYPLPSSVDGLWVADGTQGMHGKRLVRNEKRFHEISAERDYARLVTSKWVSDAMEDGWDRTPTYAHETVLTACTLQRDGFKCLVTMRLTEPDPKWVLGDSEIYCWAPDTLQIPVPLVYPGMQYFIDAVNTCPHCHRGPNRRYFPPICEGCDPNAAAVVISTIVDAITEPSLSDEDKKELGMQALDAPVATRRYHFAGRACEQCAPALKSATETPGWTE